MSIVNEILNDLKAALTRPLDETPPAEGTAPGPAPSPEEPAPAEAQPRRAVRRPSRRVVVAGLAAAGLLLLAGALVWLLSNRPPQPPAEDVVATYEHPSHETESTTRVTQDDFDAYLAALPAERRASIPDTQAGYHAALQEMVVEQLLWDWLQGRLGPDSVQALVLDAAMGRFPVDSFDQVTAAIPISETEIQQYFEEHPEKFSGQALSQVRDEILAELKAERRGAHIEGYLAELTSESPAVKHTEVLAVPEPDEQALRAYYEANLSDFVPPREATVDWLRFRRSAEAREQAEAARLELEQGADLGAVAQAYAEWASPAHDLQIVEGQRGDEFDRVVFGLQPGALSPVFDGGDAYYVVRLKQIHEESAPSFDAVRDEIRDRLWAATAETWFAARKNSPVLAVDGWTYHAGDFYAAFQALPPEWRAEYHSAEGLNELLDRTVTRLAVVQDAGQRGYPPPGHDDPGTRLMLLVDILGTEPSVDLSVSDDEVLEYYNEHPDLFLMPTRFQVGYIALEPSFGETARSRAWTQAQKAYDRLLQFERPLSEAQFRSVAEIYGQDPETTLHSDWIAAGEAQEIQVVDTGEIVVAHPLYDTLLDLETDDLTPPFELEGTIYIVYVWEREEEHSLTLWEATNYLDAELGAEKEQAAVEEVTRQLFAQIELMTYPDNLEPPSTP